MGFPLFVVACVVALVIAATALTLRREHRRVRLAVARHHGGPPSPYELAYLSGGSRRVINTALGLLARTGVIRVSRGGQVSLVAGAGPSSDAIEHAVTEALRLRGGSVPVGELRHAVADGQAIEGLRYRLLGLGLLVPEGALDHARTLLSRLLAFSAVGVVLAVGILVIGIEGRLAGVAPLVGLIAGLGGLLAYAVQRRALRDVLSRAGHDVLASARSTYARGARPVVPDLTFAVGVPVALYGLGELNEPGLEEGLQRQGASGSGSGCATGACGGGSSSGGWGGSSDGGDGSGDGGGSSCGGCGGGGCGG